MSQGPVWQIWVKSTLTIPLPPPTVHARAHTHNHSHFSQLTNLCSNRDVPLNAAYFFSFFMGVAKKDTFWGSQDFWDLCSFTIRGLTNSKSPPPKKKKKKLCRYCILLSLSDAFFVEFCVAALSFVMVPSDIYLQLRHIWKFDKWVDKVIKNVLWVWILWLLFDYCCVCDWSNGFLIIVWWQSKDVKETNFFTFMGAWWDWEVKHRSKSHTSRS